MAKTTHTFFAGYLKTVRKSTGIGFGIEILVLPEPSMEIAIVLGLLVLAIFLFSTEKLSVDVVTILLILVLVVTGILEPHEAYAGFSSDFIIILASIFVITGAIQESGILDIIVAKFSKLKNKGFNLILFYIITFTSFIGAFMNNTTATALLINPVISIAKKANISASKFLIPLAFASIVGGNCTLIGTSTNIAVSGYMEKAGLEPVGMFEILWIGIIITIVLIIYMMTIGKYFLPDHRDNELIESYKLREYLSEIVVKSNSKLIGQTIFKSDITKQGFRILNIIRHGAVYPILDSKIEEGDTFLIKGNVQDLVKIKETSGIEIKGDSTYNVTKNKEMKLAELLIPANSDVANSTIREANFRQRYGVTVLAIHRAHQVMKQNIKDIKLHVGDLLLVQGKPEGFNYLHENGNVLLLDEHEPNMVGKNKGILTLLIFAISIALGTFEVLPFSVTFLIAAVLTVLIRAVQVQKVYSLIDFKLLVLIGGMTAFGTAMTKSGTDKFLAMHIVDLFDSMGTTAIMAGFILLTILLTQPMSNAAAALVVLPIAIQTATQLDVNPRTFAIGIMMGASVSLITPFEPSCILVYGPGKYKFIDFIKIGGLLTLVIFFLLIWLVPYFWPY